MNQQSNISYLREPQVSNITKLSKSTRWRLEKAGKFPKRRQLSANAVGWLASEIEEWIASRETCK
ncbi:MAG TPA: AlpA family phage regulatory protein [Gammaproteobacteria bacterium]|nr:AlpA family phage regulatory protein [Gammaproteobacteria bacterium]